MHQDNRIFVAGHTGMVGSALVRLLEKDEYTNLILRTHAELDLLDGDAVKDFFDTAKPEIVIFAAARVGGIKANIEHPAEFLYENLCIQNNVIHAAHLHKVKKFCFLGTSCIYPRECPQPMKEEYVLGGHLEPTNEGYALAKIAGLKMVSYYRKQYGFPGISIMPCNLYGTNDSYDPEHSHVLSALVRKFVDATDNRDVQVTLWGTGSSCREFMHVDDAAEAVLFFLGHCNGEQWINVGPGREISIRELAAVIAEKTGYKGQILWDPAKPDGMPHKCLDVSRMRDLGFFPKISLSEGIERTIREYKTLKKERCV